MIRPHDPSPQRFVAARMARIALIGLTLISTAAAVGTAVIWVRSLWVLEAAGSSFVELTARGSARTTTMTIGTFPACVVVIRGVDDGPRTSIGAPGSVIGGLTLPTRKGTIYDNGWQWSRSLRQVGSPEPVTLRDLWFRVSFHRDSLPPRPSETIGDHGYSLNLVVPDWVIVAAFLILPACLLWHRWQCSTRRRRAFELVGTQEIGTGMSTDRKNGTDRQTRATRQTEAGGSH